MADTPQQQQQQEQQQAAAQTAALQSNTTTDHLEQPTLENDGYDANILDEAGELVRARFLDFLSHSEHANLYRRQALKNSNTSDMDTIVVDHAHLRDYDGELAEALDGEFTRFHGHLRRAVSEFVHHVHQEEDVDVPSDFTKAYFVSLFNLPNVICVRMLRTEMIGRLCSIAGTVTRVSAVLNEIYIRLGDFYYFKKSSENASIFQNIKYQNHYTQ